MIDCVLELTTVVETQIANQHEVTKGTEKREEVEVGDSCVLLVCLHGNKCAPSCRESAVSRASLIIARQSA